MEAKKINIKVAGNIISELSEKIPTQIVALNELIKNSYDAFATEVKITLDYRKSKLIIEDNGNGMSEDDIRRLFHISESEKKYGKLTFNSKLGLKRRTQGSKGLGFLSVFKFGSQVVWITAQNGVELRFSANRDEIVKLKNISDYEVILEKREVEYRGTIIEIDVDISGYIIKSLIEYLNNNKTALKIVNSFYDDEFKIKLNAGTRYESKKKEVFLKESRQSILYTVKYSSLDKVLKFYFGKKLINKSEYTIKSNYKLDINLNIYYFAFKRDKNNISELFCREKDNHLTPLIYINNNLFANYELFDPDIMRSVKSSSMLPQIIGYINIESDNVNIDFNSDRTNLVDNEFTNLIKSDLKELNILIQKTGSQLKDKYKEKMGGKDKKEEDGESDDDFGIIDKVSPAYINLTGSIFSFEIPSKQLYLYNYISEVKNSKGKNVDPRNVKIFVDNKESINGILESVNTQSVIEIEFCFDDEETGRCIQRLTFNFHEKKNPIIGESELIPLIALPNKSYKIKIPFLGSLINQINELSQYKNDYKEVIACSLRAIFDICVFELRMAKNHIGLINNLKDEKDLIECVAIVVNYVNNNNILINKIKHNIACDFSSLKNKLLEQSFKDVVKKAHLGAHKSKKYITDEEIKDIADKAAYFSVITNELLYIV